jgi:uncharacterized protein (TIGR04255 family)
MPFPPTNRVLYDLNPLDEVVCQVRFPSILRIDTEPPAAFQEQIRAEYPNYEQVSPLRFPTNVPPQLAQLLAADLPFARQKSHEFASRDRVWKVSITRDYLALTCARYERWERFRERFAAALAALSQQYAPAFFTRIGLRYQDIISRRKLNLRDDTPWSELISAPVASLLGTPETAADVDGLQTVVSMKLPDEIGNGIFRFSLAEMQTDHERVFLIDGDFFTEQQTEPANVFDRLDAFHGQARLFFRWCITDTLHRAMLPQPVPNG